VMRAVTLKAAGHAVAQLIGYYAGLARDQQRRDGAARGPVDYYLDPSEPPGRWWGSGCAAVGLDGEVLSEQLQSLLEGRDPATGATLGRRFGDQSPRGFDATFSAAKAVSVLWALSADPWVRAEVTAANWASKTTRIGRADATLLRLSRYPAAAASSSRWTSTTRAPGTAASTALIALATASAKSVASRSNSPVWTPSDTPNVASSQPAS
jgi:TrwC relaxase